MISPDIAALCGRFMPFRRPAQGQAIAMMPGSDVDTIANADLLWRLVHLVQDTIHIDGSPLLVGMNGDPHQPLAAIRKLADELDPENGRF